MKKLILVTLLFINFSMMSQTLQERKIITKNYNLKKLHELAIQYKKNAEKERAIALEKAKKNGWKIKGSEKGKAYSLIRLTPDGKPIYYETYNYYSAKTIRTDRLYNGGSLGLNIQGQNMIVGLWDGGPVRLTHNFLNGRVIQKDGISFSSPDDLNRHATHVSGTMISNGPIRYRGMAFNASEWAHDWFNDNSEMVQRASEGLLVSNHSYGISAFNFLGQLQIDLYWFGKYDNESRNWDNIMYNAPYYLIVDAAGNDRSHQANATNKGGYDMLTGHANAKNVITVAAVSRVDNYTGPNSVQMSSFSNWGPTDDGRIKPDISAQGINVSSCISDSNSATDSYSGTSMASPAVTGSLILLQQLYNQTYGSYMLSSTLKGLVLHTADEAGAHPGPDYQFGWGLMNTATAAQAIIDNNLNSVIKEVTLNDGDTYSFDVKTDGTSPLMASICWTDPAGQVIYGTPQDMLDNSTPMLVNDLDIRITHNGNTFYPWILDPANPGAAATQGDNFRDNFEKININNPSAGLYTISITHKGNLKSGKQKVSIIVTGINNPFAINSTNGDNKSICSDNNSAITYNFKYTKASNITGNTSFSLTGLPTGATATFTPAALSAEGNFSLEITGLNNVSAGKYTMQVVGTNGSNVISKDIQLHVLKNNFAPQVLISPINNAQNVRRPFSLEWEEHPNAEQYNLQVSVDPNFSNIIIDKTLNTTSYLITEHTYGISEGSTYYWRVRPVNSCAQGNFSEERNFTTLAVNCNLGYNTTPVNIPATANTSPIESTINFAQSETIAKMTVYVDITHNRISDLEIKLVSPSNTEVVLNQSGTCFGNYKNIQVTYDDFSENNLECFSAPPALRNDMKPFEALSTFSGEDSSGNWILKVDDPVNGEGGTLNLWAIEICEEILGTENVDFDLFKVWPNPAKGQINLKLRAGKDVYVKLVDMSGRIIFDRTYHNSKDVFTKNIIFGNLKKGSYLLLVADNNKHAVKQIIIK